MSKIPTVQTLKKLDRARTDNYEFVIVLKAGVKNLLVVKEGLKGEFTDELLIVSLPRHKLVPVVMPDKPIPQKVTDLLNIKKGDVVSFDDDGQKVVGRAAGGLQTRGQGTFQVETKTQRYTVPAELITSADEAYCGEKLSKWVINSSENVASHDECSCRKREIYYDGKPAMIVTDSFWNGDAEVENLGKINGMDADDALKAHCLEELKTLVDCNTFKKNKFFFETGLGCAVQFIERCRGIMTLPESVGIKLSDINISK